ncbi:MAG: M48 family metalloprotease [Deltaproteobacteria bacterium]|nr:M48 family metalloprotease [Deltaproteobacteria bacterium]
MPNMLMVFLVFFVSCTWAVEQAPDLLSEEQERKVEEYRQEVELGRNMAGRILQYYGTYGDEELIRYVNRVGLYVGEYADFPNRVYHFTVLDTDVVNAFACPGGYILITLGTIKNLKNEAELAAVLGHEITHVGKKHIFTTLQKMGESEQEEAAKRVGEAGFLDDIIENRKRPSSDYSSDTGAILARYLSGAAGAGISLIKAASAGMFLILEKGLDKKLEFEADEEGVQFAINAGYEPFAMANFLERVEKNKGKLNVKILEKTHPKMSDRRDQVQALLKRIRAREMIGAEVEDRFRKYTAKLTTK